VEPTEVQAEPRARRGTGHPHGDSGCRSHGAVQVHQGTASEADWLRLALAKTIALAVRGTSAAWALWQLNKLQSSEDRNLIVLNEPLKQIFRTETLSFALLPQAIMTQLEPAEPIVLPYRIKYGSHVKHAQ